MLPLIVWVARSSRNRSLRERPHLPRLDYQKAGPRFSPSVAHVDLTIVPDPEAWLIERLGPLVTINTRTTQTGAGQ
jgi:hypothetical protein